jgi:hypothetical protein
MTEQELQEKLTNWGLDTAEVCAMAGLSDDKTLGTIAHIICCALARGLWEIRKAGK